MRAPISLACLVLLALAARPARVEAELATVKALLATLDAAILLFEQAGESRKLPLAR
jgi:hypothetical protein